MSNNEKREEDNMGWGALIGAGISLAGSLMANKSQSDTNNQNMQMSENLTREQWARDDNAVQRRAIDLEKAGINPLLAGLGSAGNTPGQLIPMQATNNNLLNYGADFVNGWEKGASAEKTGAETKNIEQAMDIEYKEAHERIQKLKADSSLTRQQVQHEQVKMTSTFLNNVLQENNIIAKDWEIQALEEQINNLVKTGQGISLDNQQKSNTIKATEKVYNDLIKMGMPESVAGALTYNIGNLSGVADVILSKIPILNKGGGNRGNVGTMINNYNK